MKIKIILMVLVAFLIYIIFIQILPNLNEKYYGCYIFDDLYNQKGSFKVRKKFIDSNNHNYQKITYLNKDNVEKTMTFGPELADMYDFLNIDDSIIKEKNSVYYRVKSKSTRKDTVFKFVTTCKESVKKLK
jgi:hypothetical protein